PRALVLLRSEDAGEPPPPSFRSEGVFAVELLDAAESRRWLYLGPDDGTLELSTVDEVDYDPGRDRIAAQRYTLGFERPQVNDFCSDHAEGPISITSPFALAYLFGDLDVKIFLDFRDLDGFELLSEGLAGRTIRVGEKGVPTTARTTWFLLRKGGTAFLHRL